MTKKRSSEIFTLKMEIFPEIGPRKNFLVPQIRRQVSAHGYDFVFYSLRYFEPVEFFENRSDVVVFGVLVTARAMMYVAWFGVNNKKCMAFTEKDKISTKVLRQEHGFGAKRFLNEFSSKGWCLSYVIKLLKKIDETGTVERKPGSGKTRTVENVELVERLVLSQENAPGTHKTVASTSTVVCP